MEGILIEILDDKSYDIVDTRNDQYGRLRLYYNCMKERLPQNSTVEFEIKTNSTGGHYAKFISLVERNQTQFNTEDRSQWYGLGEDEEAAFIANIVPLIGNDIRINPKKAHCKWAIDLYDYTLNRPADLKTQNTPFFFVSRYKYKGKRCNPAYSVTFNRKDYNYYKEKYPNCDIYFWIHWTQCTYKETTVPEIYGVWKADFSKIAECIENGQAPLHPYMHRQNDDHNAKDSYIFNLQDTDIFQQLI